MPPRRLSRRTQQLRRRQRRAERIARRAAAARHLREVAARDAARGPRRSLRLQCANDNASYIANGEGPYYSVILFGEPGYVDIWDTSEFPYEGFEIFYHIDYSRTGYSSDLD